MDIKTLLVWVTLGFLFLILTNIAFAHAIKRNFKTRGQKVLWCIIALIPFLGFIVYFIFGARKGSLSTSGNS